MMFPDENWFDDVVLNMGLLMALKVAGVVMLLVTYAHPS